MVNSYIGDSGVRTLVLRPNQSLSASQAWRFLNTLIGLSLVVGITCAYWGAWMVLPFTLLEVSLLVAAFYWVRWQQGYREVLLIDERYVQLEAGIGKPSFSWKVLSSYFRLMVHERRAGRSLALFICGPDSRLEIGRCLNNQDKKQLVSLLRNMGIRVQSCGPSTCVEF